MKEGFLDDLTTQLKETMASLESDTREMFKGVKPYRMVKMSPEDRIAEYLNLAPEVKQQLRVTSPEWAIEENELVETIKRRIQNV